MSSTVIIGAGHAGFQLAHSLRQLGYTGRISLIGNEGVSPYQRPPLSKAYLAGKMDVAGLSFRPKEFFVDQTIELVEGEATGIDRENQRVFVDGHQALAYDHLVLATGSRRRPLTIEGGTLDGVFGLATLGDADNLKRALSEGRRRAIVIGAGFIGLEFAASARQFGLDVAVVDIAPRVMARAVSPAMSQFFREVHEESGVQFMFETGLSHLEGENGHVSQLVTSNGDVLATDLVVAGIGVLPNDQLAREAGLQVANGVVVDEHLTTSDPRIFAIGDCANFPERSLAARHRLESVQNATDQAKAVASFITGGERVPYEAVPWFWSDQGPHKLQIAGLALGANFHVERRDDKGISVFVFRDGVLAAVETANHAADHMAARRLFGTTLRRPSPQEVEQPDFSLKNHVLNAG